METKGKNVGHIASKATQKFALVLLLGGVIICCSKGDDEPILVNNVDGNGETTSNSGNTSPNDPIGASISIKSIDPASPATLKFGDSIAITYDYNVTRSLGARIWVVPYADGDLAPSASYSLSPVYKGTGTETVYISVSEGDTVMVDKLKTQINTAGFVLLGVLTGSTTLSESFEDVDYMFTN